MISAFNEWTIVLMIFEWLNGIFEKRLSDSNLQPILSSIKRFFRYPEFKINVAFKTIDIREENSIKYSEHRIQRLGNGYDTDCYSYETEHNFNYYRIRTDCVNDCYQSKMRQLCKIDRGLILSNYLLRKEYLANGNDRLSSCYENISDFNKQNFAIVHVCEKMCKVECNIKYYSIEIESIDPLYNTAHTLTLSSNIILKWIW